MAEPEETDQYGRTIFKVPQKKVPALSNTPSTAAHRGKKVKPVERKNLEPVNRDLRPEDAIGKTFTINAESIKSSQLGASMSAAPTQGAAMTSAFHCETCKCSLKDSQAWFDHINGKKHNQLLGMSMVVQKVSVDKVKAKLALLAQKKKAGKEFAMPSRPKLEEFANSDSDDDSGYQVNIEPSKKPKVQA